MARKIGLSVYGVSIIYDNNKTELHNVYNGKGILDIFQTFAENSKDVISTDPNTESVFCFERIEREIVKKEDKIEFEILYGRVKTGEYGIESELINIHNKNIYKRKSEEADIFPFGFCVAISSGQVEKGVVLIQNIGNMGMKIALQRKMQECFNQCGINYSVLLGQIVPKAYLDKFFKQGVLQKIRMIRYEIPEDISERIGINYGVKQTREERVICKPMGFMERKQKELSEWRAGQRSCTKIIEIEDFEYDDLKLEFNLGNTRKVISLKDTAGVRVTEDITDKVNIQGGNPEFMSLKMVLKESAREYLVGMGFLEQ